MQYPFVVCITRYELQGAKFVTKLPAGKHSTKGTPLWSACSASGCVLSVCLSVGMYVCVYLCLSVNLSMCLSTRPSLHVSVCVSISPCVCLPVHLSVCVSVCLSISPCVCLSVCLSMCLSVCLSAYGVWEVQCFPRVTLILVTRVGCGRTHPDPTEDVVTSDGVLVPKGQ